MQDYDKGGLKMINVKNFIIALKTTWIRRLIMQDSKYKHIFELQYAKINSLIHRGSEFAYKLKIRGKNKFWNDILDSWIILQSQMKPQAFSDILGMNLWDNQFLKIQNETVFYPKWWAKKIYLIKDLMNVDGNLLDFNGFVEKYELNINFMEFFSIRTVIETYIKSSGLGFQNSSVMDCQVPFNIKQIVKHQKGCREVYKVLNDKDINSKNKQKWEEDLNEELDWKSIYILPAKCSNNTKIHWFQYRIIHRILATNDLLYKYKIKQDNLCSFCKTSRETLIHLFWDCEIVQEFWENVETWIAEKSDYIIIADELSCIFGLFRTEFYNITINYILILTRYYIYKCKIKNKKLNMKTWKHEVKNFIMIEKMTAIKKSRYDKFTQEWEKWLILFDENE